MTEILIADPVSHFTDGEVAGLQQLFGAVDTNLLQVLQWRLGSGGLEATIEGAGAHVKLFGDSGKFYIVAVVFLQPSLGGDYLFIGMSLGVTVVATAFVVAAVVKVTANFMGKMALDMAGDGLVVEGFDKVYGQIGQGVDAGTAIEIAGLGGEILAFESHLWIVPLKLIEVVPVGGGGFAVQQSGFGQQAAAGAHGADGGTLLLAQPEPVEQGAVLTNDRPGVAPQAGQENEITGRQFT